MSRAGDGKTAKVVHLPLAVDVRRAIGKLTSLHDGDIGVIETVACGRRAIPGLRAVLFAREPSGVYEARRRAVEALAQLHAFDVLIEYLRAPRDVADPVEHTGEEAVTNAAARALAGSNDDRVIPLLLELTERSPLAGVVESLGRLRRVEALPYFIEALAEDFTRPAAEVAIRTLGPQARAVLLGAATTRSPLEGRETVSSRRRRGAALGLFAEFGPPAKEHRSALHRLMHDEDREIAALACRICLADANESAEDAIQRLIELLPAADWLLSEEIEDCLAEHFDKAKTIIDSILQHHATEPGLASPGARAVEALHRVVTRAASGGRRTGA
jgi:hypothetical protein